MAWDFAAEIHALTGFDGDEGSTAGNSGEVNTLHINQWLNDGVKEVINQLPAHLLEKCTDKTTVTGATALDFDTATVGKVLYCTRNNGSFDIPCRLVGGQYAGLLDDSTADNYYATADDPAYFLRDNKAEIKPNPDGNGGSFYHILYPSGVTSDDSSISNFPQVAQYLVVLYAAIRAVQERMANEASNEDSELYALHSDKYAKLSAEYQKGLTLLSGVQMQGGTQARR